jgi:nucleoid DNA-binding protein
MSAIVANDLSINTELDGKALAEIVGGKARKGRNPQTGDPIKIKARLKPLWSWGFSSISN